MTARKENESFAQYKERRTAENKAAKYIKDNPKMLFFSTRPSVLNSDGTTTHFKGRTYVKEAS